MDDHELLPRDDVGDAPDGAGDAGEQPGTARIAAGDGYALVPDEPFETGPERAYGRPWPPARDAPVYVPLSAPYQRYRDAITRCQHEFRGILEWAGVIDARHVEALLEYAGEQLDSGEFFLSRIGRVCETDPALAIALLVIRTRLQQEYALQDGMEQLLLDQAMMALYHQLRLHEMIGNVEARAEAKFFGDEPLRAVNERYSDYEKQFDVDEHLRRMRERLLPALDRCQRMLLRSLRELRLLRMQPPCTIHHAQQVNVAHQQIVAASTER